MRPHPLFLIIVIIVIIVIIETQPNALNTLNTLNTLNAMKEIFRNFLPLELIKKHLNIDPYFKDDDRYLMQLGEVAINVIEKHIDRDLSCYLNAAGELPAPLIQAALLMVGNLYQSRESVSFASAVEIPLSYTYLLDLYKNYGTDENKIDQLYGCGTIE